MWRNVTNELSQEEGLINVLDVPLLAIVCANYSTFVTATKALNKEGYMVPGQRTTVANKWLQIRREAQNAILKAIPELALSPLSREKLMMLLEREEANEPLE